MTCTTCPHCGYDLERVELLKVGDLEIVRGSEIRWKGQRVALSMSQALILIAIAKADGAWIGTAALADVVGYDGDDPAKLVDVHICRIRKAFRAVDPGFNEIERQSGWTAGGFTRWRVAAPVSLVWEREAA